MIKNPWPILASFALLSLAGCGAPVGLAAWSAGGMYVTKPGSPPPADLENQIAPHESWCYSTMATVECFAEPQDTPPARLVNVDPPGRYPLNAKMYQRTLAESQALYNPAPVMDTNVVPIPAAVEPVQVAPAPTQIVPKAAPTKKPAAKSTAKKHKKKTKKPVTPPQPVPNPKN